MIWTFGAAMVIIVLVSGRDLHASRDLPKGEYVVWRKTTNLLCSCAGDSRRPFVVFRVCQIQPLMWQVNVTVCRSYCVADVLEDFWTG